jgi:2-phosphoglycerate kinase
VPGDVGHHDRLAQVRWIGGGSGAGKSTVAARLAEEHDLQLSSTDASIRTHLERSSPAMHPLVHAFVAMTMDERWVDRSPEEMLRTFHGYQGEGFEMVLEDVLALSESGPVLVEGFRLLPRLVAPRLGPDSAAVWLLPSRSFRRFALEKRGSTAAMLAPTSDPARAFENLLERDALFTDEIRSEALALGLKTVEIDIGDSIEAVTAQAAEALGLAS